MSLRADLRALPRAVWVQCAATLVNRAGTMVLPFLLLYLTRDLGLSPSRGGRDRRPLRGDGPRHRSLRGAPLRPGRARSAS